MAKYELTQVRDALVSILRRAAQRGRDLREQRAAVSEAASKPAVGDVVETAQTLSTSKLAAIINHAREKS